MRTLKRIMQSPPKTTDTTVERPNYQTRVAFLLGAISNLIAAGGGRLYRKAFGLGLGEARLLYVLGYEPDLTAGRASQIMGIDKGATSRTLAALERRGLVNVSVASGDARQRAIQLTIAGNQLRDRYMVVAAEREKQLLSVFSADEVETLSTLLQRLREHVPNVRTPRPLPFVARTHRPEPSRKQSAGGRNKRRSAG